MKKLIFICMLMLVMSCAEPGTSFQRLTGNEMNLPPELKGLEIYYVSTGKGNYVNVAVLKNQVNSLTYPVGKITESVIMLNSPTSARLIEGEVLVENDELIVIRKK
jgi:hypothetical protein